MSMKQAEVDVNFWAKVYADAILRATEGLSEIDADDAMKIALSVVCEELDDAKNNGRQIDNQN